MWVVAKNLWRSICVVVLVGALAGTAVGQAVDPADSLDRPPSSTGVRGWPGLPPDCWTEPRMIHENESRYDWRSRTTIERVQASAPNNKSLSPNGAYYYSVSSEAPSMSVLIFAEKEHLVRISFANSRGLTDVKWINEKLLYLRAWWGRIAATDLVFDVEQERVVLAESVTDGQIAMEQARESCPLLGGCRCIPKQD